MKHSTKENAMKTLAQHDAGCRIWGPQPKTCSCGLLPSPAVQRPVRRQTKRDAHRARMAELIAKAQAIVATGVCPQRGTGLRRNLALAARWQCDADGRPDFRRPENRDKPDCSFQTFTE